MGRWGRGNEIKEESLGIYKSVMLNHGDKSLLYEMMTAIKSKSQNWILFNAGKARIGQLLILTDS